MSKTGRHTGLVNLAREYCAQYATLPSRTIARMMLADNEDTYGTATIDQARDAVRYARGTHGTDCRLWNKNIIEAVNIPVNIKENDGFAIKDLTKTLQGKGLVLADLHIPFHDPTALALALNYGLKNGYTDYVIINGDFLDMYEFSFFCRDPRLDRFKQTREEGWWVLDLIEERFGDDTKIVFKLSNHDLRWVKFMATHAPQLLKLKDFTLEKVLKLQDWNIIKVGYMEQIKIHKLNILHGHEFGNGFSVPVNPARSAYLKTGACTLVAHSHQTSEHSSTTINDELVTCWSQGCLCELHPNYRSIANKWNHGFACLDVDSKGFLVTNKRIHKQNVY
jgi:hypothetical protein